jgi:hypothetical protein
MEDGTGGTEEGVVGTEGVDGSEKGVVGRKKQVRRNERRNRWNGGIRWSGKRSGGTEWGKVPLGKSAIGEKCH